MKGLSMNKMLGSIKRRPTARKQRPQMLQPLRHPRLTVYFTAQPADSDDASGDSSSQTPEATAGRFVVRLTYNLPRPVPWNRAAKLTHYAQTEAVL